VPLPDNPYSFPRHLVRGFKFSGLLAVQTIIALIATGILEFQLQRTFRPTSIETVLWREWIYSVVIAFGLGFSIQRLWPNSATKWVWLLPTLWFGFGSLIAMGHGRLWNQITGTACENGMGDPQCRGWFLFTITWIRAASYSAGAYVRDMVGSTQRVEPVSSAIDDNTQPPAL